MTGRASRPASPERIVTKSLPSRKTGEPLKGLHERLGDSRLVLRGSVDDAADRALARYGIGDETEARLADQLANSAPLAEPAFFLEAHRNVIHAIEVLDREGSAGSTGIPFPPAAAAYDYIVWMIANYLVKSFEKDIVNRLAELYARREAKCPPRSDDRPLLARARVETRRLTSGYRGGTSALTLVAGSATISLAASAGNAFGAFALDKPGVIAAVIVVLFVLDLALTSAMLNGAARARNRIRFLTSTPLNELWQVVGNAGKPPEDDSTEVATLAIAITTAAFVVLPLTALWFTFRP